MQHVRDLMSHAVETVGPRETLATASQKMAEHGFGALPVWYGGQLLGIISDQDITVRGIARKLDPETTPVADIMTRRVVTCYDDQSVEEATHLMEWNHLRRLVVLDRQERLTGMLTLGDLALDPGGARLGAAVLQRVAASERRQGRPFERILVALDGSPVAEMALTQIEELARRFNSTVILLRAVTPAETAALAETTRSTMHEARPIPVAALTAIEEPRADAVAYLQRIEHRLIHHGVRVQYEYPEGKPADVIVQRARHLGVDLIAMTTHSRGALGRMIFGSAAAAVLQHAPCPVLIVRPDAAGGDRS